MKLQFNQVEIVDALKQYIIKQGVSLTGKNVKIDFTAGRKASGLSADITIDDFEAIPGFDDVQAQAAPAVEATKPVLTLIQGDAAPTVEAQAPVAEVQQEATPPKASSSSLFS